MPDAAPIEIFAIGTELVLGRIQDTNSFWMAQRVAALGGDLRRITQLVDDLEQITEALAESLARGTRMILTCGGLGPTPDDLTVEAIGLVVDRPLVVDEATLDDYVRRRNLAGRDELSPGLRKMATVPEGAEVFANPAGWAPCSVVRAGDASIVILPGPPKEMEAVFTLHVEPLIIATAGRHTAALRVVVNMYESEVSPVMEETMQHFPTTYLKAYVALRETLEEALPVDIVATGDTAEAARQTLQEALAYFGNLVQARGKVMEYAEQP